MRHRVTVRLLMACGLLVGWPLAPAEAEAQTQVLNPRVLEYDVSADHAGTLPTGEPAVARYEARWYAAGATAPLTVTDLAKPAPTTGTRVRLDLTSVIGSIPIGTGYTVRVVAIGPSGEGVSEASNPFARVSPPLPATNVTLAR